MTVEHGGKTVFGANVGILMLDTRFPRIWGDVANANTWPFPVQYRIVRGATPDLVVRHRSEGLLDAFIAAGHDLVAHGVDALTTNCGFLALLQNEIRDAMPVPVVTSSIMQVPMVNTMLPAGKRAGIITISGEDLTDDHLRGALAPLDTPVIGTETGQEFAEKIIDDHDTIDFSLCMDDLVSAAHRLTDAHPDVGAIVLECTNMMPYAAEIRKITGLPVYSLYTLVTWLHAGLIPRHFPHRLDDPVHRTRTPLPADHPIHTGDTPCHRTPC
ncbi:MAG: aspartate/glutamate racemase family protein [Rhodobacteraceae bacterium]|nr:aspartate/glutamate racemase family protein [Paracoccaceae bacterium]